MWDRSKYPNMRDRRSELRSNSAPPEALLWGQLRDRRVVQRKFRRQHQIGPYIVDFFCSYAGLVVEVDGSQHFEPEGLAYDVERTAFLEAVGLRILRFTNVEVATEMEGVLERIRNAVESPPSP